MNNNAIDCTGTHETLNNIKYKRPHEPRSRYLRVFVVAGVGVERVVVICRYVVAVTQLHINTYDLRAAGVKESIN